MSVVLPLLSRPITRMRACFLEKPKASAIASKSPIAVLSAFRCFGSYNVAREKVLRNSLIPLILHLSLSPLLSSSRMEENKSNLGDRLTELLAGRITEDSRLDTITYFPRSSWVLQVEQLKKIVQTEAWGHRNCVLHNYVIQLFRVAVRSCLNDGDSRCLAVSHDGQYLCFNLSLTNRSYELIYGIFMENANKAFRSSCPLVFMGWYAGPSAERFHHRDGASTAVVFGTHLPRPLCLFDSYHELYFNPDIGLSVTESSLLHSQEDRERLASALLAKGYSAAAIADETILRAMVSRALQTMLLRIKLNPRTVVAQYYVPLGRVQMLLPLSFPNCATKEFDNSSADLAVACSKAALLLGEDEELDDGNPSHWTYVYHAILPIEQAYSNARLLSRLESDWLRI